MTTDARAHISLEVSTIVPLGYQILLRTSKDPSDTSIADIGVRRADYSVNTPYDVLRRLVVSKVGLLSSLAKPKPCLTIDSSIRIHRLALSYC